MKHRLTTWKSLLQTQVIPKWIQELRKKKEKEGKEKKADNRRDTVGKKLLRDCREFYRLVWEWRYEHVLNKDENQKALYKNIFRELGINEGFSDLCLINYKTFFNRVLNLPPDEKSKYHKMQKQKGPMKVIKKYNVKDRDLFLTHPVFSKLYVFLYYTFYPLYVKETKDAFKDVVQLELINVFKNLLYKVAKSCPSRGRNSD